MNRSDILDTAKEYVTRDRAATHGDAEDNFTQLAEWLSERFGDPVTAYDVAQMMSLFKKARAKANKAHLDNAIDCRRVDEASRQPDLLIDPPKP